MNIHKIHLTVVPDDATEFAAASDLESTVQELPIEEILNNDEKEAQASKGIHRGSDNRDNNSNIK